MKNLFSNFKGDAFGGITAGIVALPLALAFGVSSGLGPSAGLYGAIFLSFFVALFGGTNTQISGPTAPMTAVSMVIIAGIIGANNGDVAKALPLILGVFVFAGIIQVGLGLLGLGKYIKYIPYPVVSGFMTAIGVIILITQILPAVGYYPKEDIAYVQTFKGEAKDAILHRIIDDAEGEEILSIGHFEQSIEKSKKITEADIDKEAKSLAAKNASGVIGTFRVLPNALQHINWLELVLAASTIFIIFGFKKITTAIPSTLVALLVVSGVAFGFGLDYKSIQEIPSGLPIPNLEIFTKFSLTSFTPYIFSAIALALLGAIDSLLTSVVADSMTKTKHNPNKELIGQGIGNSIGAIFGGIPGAGATIRTVVNINSGGKTKLSGMISGLVLLVILLALSPVASKIPAAVLAGILVTVGIGVMDYKGLKAIPSLPREMKVGPFMLSSEVVIMVTVLLLSTFWNLVNAVGIGLIIASLIFMKRIGDVTASHSGVKTLKNEEGWKDEQNFPENLKEHVYIERVKGPLFFGSTSDFQQMSKQIPSSAKVVVLRMCRMPYMDQTGLYVIEETLVELTNAGVIVLMEGLLEQPRYMMERIKTIPNIIPKDHLFKDFDSCVDWMKNHIEELN
ncbi:SulP family inorganic anion transporter [Flavicella marina]|uniref:SulP family inorganic anion transporter n=1 Tax=Flavicella marina TaxID=1475951 RepID=UPI0012655C3F|nr:SulP family inorganic anion transporter [Flavicella marina]